MEKLNEMLKRMLGNFADKNDTLKRLSALEKNVSLANNCNRLKACLSHFWQTSQTHMETRRMPCSLGSLLEGFLVLLVKETSLICKEYQQSINLGRNSHSESQLTESLEYFLNHLNCFHSTVQDSLRYCR